jgi:hypothetical protein
MNVEYKEYGIVPCENAVGLFDLNKKVQRTKKKTGETYTDIEVVGYGMQFETCIKRIINMELNKKKSTVSLGEYIAAYRDVSDSVMSELKSLI